MSKAIEQYRGFVSPALQEELEELRLIRNEQAWQIGEITLKIIAYVDKEQATGNLQNVTYEKIYQAVAHYIDMGASRIGKIKNICWMFAAQAPTYRSLTFGYFERAYDFGPEEGVLFLDFCKEKQYKQGERVPIKELALIFNSHILGKQMTDVDPDTQLPVVIEHHPVVTIQVKQNGEDWLEIRNSINQLVAMLLGIIPEESQSPAYVRLKAALQALDSALSDIVEELYVVEEDENG